jgi:hypothetical protein
MPFSLHFPSALCAACLLLAAGRAAAEPEIPVYQDFSWPLSFTAASHGAEGKDEARAIREAAAIAHLAQEEDSWVDRYLFRPPAATANAFAAYQPPRAASADGPASVRDWLSGALGQGKSAAALLDVSSREAETGDWLSGDLAEMSRKREAKKSTALADAAAAAQMLSSVAETAAGAPGLFDVLRTDRGNANVPDGEVRSGIDAVRQAAEARLFGDDADRSGEMLRTFPANGASGEATPAWREGMAGNTLSPGPAADERENPAWMTAILSAGNPPASATGRDTWSFSGQQTAPPSSDREGVAIPSFAGSGETAERVPADKERFTPRESLPGAETAGKWSGADSSRPDVAAGTAVDMREGWNAGWRSGWNGGWGSRNSLSGGLALPVLPETPEMPASTPGRSSSPSMPNASTLPRPAWY